MHRDRERKLRLKSAERKDCPEASLLRNSIEDGKIGSLRKWMHGAKHEGLDNAV